ncbi:MAG: Inner membrane protein YbhI [Syntrophaceae bacterium PtaU1.Bin231]|nr:MAG: Inner membrane protein YbhI [Syntrophaceae bacterium PtaU1.Bin231]
MSKLKIFGFLFGIVAAFAIAWMEPPAGLTVPAMWTLGIFVGGVIFMIFDVMPDYLVTLGMCTLWALFRTVPFDKAFSFFSNANWWLMVGALGMGVAAQQCGLLRRISFLIMKLFPATFRGQTAALMGAGFVIGPLIPSSTAKGSIFAPLSVGVNDAMGYPRKSKASGGLFGAVWMGFVCIFPAYLSGSFLCYMMKSLLPKDVQAQFDWITWFLMALPWTIIVLVLSYLAIQYLYKPEKTDTLPKGYAAEQLAKMGPMSRAEKITLVVLIVALLLWMTEKVHGISAAIVALIAMIILLYAKVFDRAEFRAKMPWDVIIFVGTIIGIAAVFPFLKIDKWMGTVLAPYVGPLVSNPYAFVAGFTVFIYILRFFFISQTGTIVIFTVMFTPLAVQAGINPWIAGMITLTAIMTWNTFYQNANYIITYSATGGELVETKQMVKLSVAFMLINLLGFVISVPYWQMAGLIK